MDKIETINNVIIILEELKNANIELGDKCMLANICRETKELCDIWENENKQTKEFYRDLVGTLKYAYGTQFEVLTIPEIASVMKISIPKAEKFIHLCVNYGWIAEFSDGRFITGGYHE